MSVSADGYMYLMCYDVINDILFSEMHYIIFFNTNFHLIIMRLQSVIKFFLFIIQHRSTFRVFGTFCYGVCLFFFFFVN